MTIDTNQPSLAIDFDHGIPVVNGAPHFLVSTDYPYFRDDPANWADRLEKIKEMGHPTVTWYIPWRHHEVMIDGKRVFDFTGETQANRDVVGFMKLCKEKGLRVIAKPGPFVHAELNYGGLPDWVCPAFNPKIEAMVDWAGKPFPWGGIRLKADESGLEELPLPAPFDPVFSKEAERWLKAVTEQVIAPGLYPEGPVVLVQIGNEGIYSNHQRAPWAYDFSSSSKALYRRFLQDRYGDLRGYNRRHQTRYRSWDEIQLPQKWSLPESLARMAHFADWAEYQAFYMREIYDRLKRWVGVEAPYVINVNPPTDEPFAVDAWLSRINPDEWPDVQYGFTNWIGVACKDRSVVNRYQVMVKRARGVNYEENWGFSKLYEPEFAYDSVCFYQTLVQIAGGAAGYNVYTGVGTAHSDAQIDLVHRAVYPDCAPISAAGEWTAKASTVRLINDFFNEVGADFLETQPVRPAAWGLYLPYAHSAVWIPEDERQAAQRLGVPDAGRALLHFQAMCLDAHLDFSFTNLQLVEHGQLQGYPTLVLAAGRWMDRATQDRLRCRVEGGGRLVIIGQLPELDENLEPYAGLAEVKEGIELIGWEEFYQSTWKDFVQLLKIEAPISARSQSAEESLIWLYSHPEKDEQYLFVFSGKRTDGPVEFSYCQGGSVHQVSLTLPPQSAGVLRVEAGALTAALVKGRNEELNQALIPAVTVDGMRMVGDAPDWLWIVEN